MNEIHLPHLSRGEFPFTLRFVDYSQEGENEFFFSFIESIEIIALIVAHISEVYLLSASVVIFLIFLSCSFVSGQL
jgi:hypothetical protein